jgi:hypothetical protein
MVTPISSPAIPQEARHGRRETAAAGRRESSQAETGARGGALAPPTPAEAGRARGTLQMCCDAKTRRSFSPVVHPDSRTVEARRWKIVAVSRRRTRRARGRDRVRTVAGGQSPSTPLRGRPMSKGGSPGDRSLSCGCSSRRAGKRTAGLGTDLVARIAPPSLRAPRAAAAAACRILDGYKPEGRHATQRLKLAASLTPPGMTRPTSAGGAASSQPGPGSGPGPGATTATWASRGPRYGVLAATSW